MAREYSEEVLGDPERDGSSGEPLVYEEWKLYNDLERARQGGRVTPYCLGIGLDTLTLTATILTVVVFDDDAFDELFGEAVSVNAEGSLVSSSGVVNVTDGLRLDAANVNRLLRREPVASPASCILQRAFANRELILS